MSLNWSVEKVENYEELMIPSRDNPSVMVMDGATEACINWSLAIGMGQITETNYVEFYTRLKLMGYTDEDWRVVEGPRTLRLRDVKRRIGLSTNVSNWTKAYFMNAVYEKAEREVNIRARKEDE